jgi:hypothetical protein
MLTCLAGAEPLSDERQKIMFYRLACRLLSARCDEAEREVAETQDLSLIDADVEAIFPKVRQMVGAGLVADLDTIEGLSGR